MLKCLSATALQWFIYSSCVIVLGIGSVLVWVGFLVQSSAFIQVLDYSYAGFIVIACGGILIFIAFIGIIGAWKQRKFFLTLFIVSSIIIGALLIIFGGVLIYVRNVSEDYLKDQTSCIKHFPDADMISNQAAEVFCQLPCPCSLEQEKADELELENFYKGSAINMLNCNPCESIQIYDASVQMELEDWILNRLGYTVNETDCAVTTSQFENRYFNESSNYITLVTWIEEKFECSGLCTYNKLLFFSDVNSAYPNEACYGKVKGWAQKNFLNYGIVSIALGVYQLIILYFTFALCCCPKRKLDLPPEALNSPSKAIKNIS